MYSLPASSPFAIDILTDIKEATFLVWNRRSGEYVVSGKCVGQLGQAVVSGSCVKVMNGSLNGSS